MILEHLRYISFWIIDVLKGSKIKKHLADITRKLENNQVNEAKPQKKDLINVLNHATTTTLFYKPYSNYINVENFPVINKNIIRENLNQFQSELFKNRKKYTQKTSGSTGTPFEIYQDKNKRYRNTADSIYFSKKAGYKIGNKLTFFRLWDAFSKKSNHMQWIQNIIPIDVFELRKEKNLKKVLTSLRKSKASNSWIGYVSAYKTIIDYATKNGIPKISNKLKSIIAISEALDSKTKNTMYNYFGTEVVSRYSNTENGILAQQPLGDKPYFIINTASYYIEVLEIDSNKKIALGKPGRIVVTDLYNYTMPLIRYDTGDIGILNKINNQIVFTQINGRAKDIIYDTKGNIITTNIVLLVNDYPELKQCQLIQRAIKTYHFKLNINSPFLREKEFINKFKLYLGNDAIITMEYVDEIPLLSSGKRRVMVNEMNH